MTTKTWIAGNGTTRAITGILLVISVIVVWGGISKSNAPPAPTIDECDPTPKSYLQIKVAVEARAKMDKTIPDVGQTVDDLVRLSRDLCREFHRSRQTR